MLVEIVLVVIIAILCGLLAWKEWEGRLERNKFINALMSKNAQEMANLDLADKTQIKAEVPNKESDFVSPENLSQKDWEEAVKNV